MFASDTICINNHDNVQADKDKWNNMYTNPLGYGGGGGS